MKTPRIFLMERPLLIVMLIAAFAILATPTSAPAQEVLTADQILTASESNKNKEVDLGKPQVELRDTFKEAGCAANDIRVDMQTLYSDQDGSDTEIKVTNTNPETCKLSGRNLFFTGIRLGYLHKAGIGTIYVRMNRKGTAPLFHVDAEYATNQFFGDEAYSSMATAGIAKDFGRTGIFAGMNLQVLTVKNGLISGSPAFHFPGAGVDIGWAKAWGKKKRIMTSVRVTMSLVRPSDMAAILDGRVGFSYRIGR